MIPSRKAWVGSMTCPLWVSSTFLFYCNGIKELRQRQGGVRSRAPGKGWRSLARPAVAPAREDGSPPARQNLPLNLPTNRRLCSTVGGRIVERWIVHCCAVSAARSRAATMTNLARSSLALVLPALFGAAKSCVLVNLFTICPRLSVVASRQRPDSTSDHGHLMASVQTR